MTLKDHEGHCDLGDAEDFRRENGHTRWYVVQCQPHRESIAAQELAKQGFRSFCPRRLKTRRHARRIEAIRSPFFPGYIFLSLNLELDRWRSVNGTRGVSRIIAFGDTPTPIPFGIVETLIGRCGEDGILSESVALEIGQSVRVLAGPFADMIGTLERLEDRDRVRVLLNIMGGNVPVGLNRHAVGS